MSAIGHHGDGVIDGSADPENPEDYLGGPCGSDVGTCKLGTATCVSGEVKCVGSVDVAPELCDGLDNDCNGHIDDPDTVKCGSGFCGGSDPPQCLDLCADDGTCPNGLGCASIHVSGGATTETRRGCAFFRE